MEKKKMKVWKKILIVVGVIFAIFVIHTVRNMIIIKKLSNKLKACEDSSNYYIKSTSTQGNVIESFNKDGRYIVKLENVSPTGIRRLINYCDGETVNTYIESETDSEHNKVAILNSNGLPSAGQITNWFYTNDMKEFILMSMMASIRSAKLNGKECYKVGALYASNILILAEGKFELYIEKDTGLTIRNQNGTITDENGDTKPIIIDYEYKFDVVTDEDLVEPDISEYEIQK